MFRNFFTKIISRVVRKLIYPELVEIRLAIEKIDVTPDAKVTEGCRFPNLIDHYSLIILKRLITFHNK